MDKGTVKAAPAKVGAASPSKKVAKKATEKALPYTCQKDMLAILGTADSLPMAPYENPEFEIWGVSPVVTYPVCKRYDVLFEMHQESYWGQTEILKRIKHSSGDVPIYMQEKTEKIPRSITYPLDLILEYRKYHTTGITYMLALAYHMFKTTGKPNHVALFGVHMQSREEYSVQRPACEYWLGRMEGAGMDIFLAPGGALLASDSLYGYENYNAVCLRFKERAQALAAGEQHCVNQTKEWDLKRAKQQGAKEENEYWLRKHQTGTEMSPIETDVPPPAT